MNQGELPLHRIQNCCSVLIPAQVSIRSISLLIEQTFQCTWSNMGLFEGKVPQMLLFFRCLSAAYQNDPCCNGNSGVYLVVGQMLISTIFRVFLLWVHFTLRLLNLPPQMYLVLGATLTISPNILNSQIHGYPYYISWSIPHFWWHVCIAWYSHHILSPCHYIPIHTAS